MTSGHNVGSFLNLYVVATIHRTRCAMISAWYNRQLAAPIEADPQKAGNDVDNIQVDTAAILAAAEPSNNSKQRHSSRCHSPRRRSS